jgi:type IV secretion system protein VirB8
MLWGSKRPETPQRDETGLSWEVDIVSNLRQAQRRDRMFMVALLVLAFVQAGAIVSMLPLRKVVPYVVMVDKLTGEARPVNTATEVVSAGTLNEKSWIQEFVIARERYSYRILQRDYDQVKRMAGPQVWAAYDKQFEGENALDKKYAENVEILPTIMSITLSDGGLATVRYELKTRDVRSTSGPSLTRRVATLRYKFEPRVGVSEAEAILNPLGMSIVGYQSDPELMSTEGGKP